MHLVIWQDCEILKPVSLCTPLAVTSLNALHVFNLNAKGMGDEGGVEAIT